VFLASRSPRRQELLTQVGIRFELLDFEIDETPHVNEQPERYVERMAIEKARAGVVLRRSDAGMPVVAADTAVVVDGQILGKPRDVGEALAHLRALSGRSHLVLSAVAVASPEPVVAVVPSCVTFRALSDAECRAYCATGEPMDKAGSYGIQGRGAMFIRHLEGSYSAVMGLPLFETCQLLSACGVAPGPTDRSD